MWDGQPYLTLSGLFRVTLHAINNFIWKCESVETEPINWQDELPGMVTLELNPQYWIWQTENFSPSQINKRFSAFLSQVANVRKKKEPITDLSQLMELIENTFPQTSKKYWTPMLAMYWLYNAIISDEIKRPNWKEFLETHIEYIDKCSIETMLVKLLLGKELPWSGDECVNVYKDFDRKRFHKGAIEVPKIVEVALLASIANKALEEENYEMHGWLLNTAVTQASGHLDIQQLLQISAKEKQKVDLLEF